MTVIYNAFPSNLDRFRFRNIGEESRIIKDIDCEIYYVIIEYDKSLWTMIYIYREEKYI